jgi:thiopeptide-type bacteriocin biosynthesis protein
MDCYVRIEVLEFIMKLNIHPQLVFRVPRFSVDATLSESWEELKGSISESSKDFYQQIKDVTPQEVEFLPFPVYHTIWKYFNRSKFRATPFGTFAGLGTVKMDAANPATIIKISDHQEVKKLVEWEFKNGVQYTFAEMIAQDMTLFSNSSYYITLDAVRYLMSVDGTFELVDIDHDDQMLYLLKFFCKPKPISEFNSDAGENWETIWLPLIEHMITVQLLFPSCMPNIIGEDYFERMQIQAGKEKYNYIISNRSLVSGQPDPILLRHIKELLTLMGDLAPTSESQGLLDFVNKFRKKFEQKEVPIMVALDPELGVGYQDLEQACNTDDEFMDSIANKDKLKTNDVKLDQKLLRVLLANASGSPESVDIEQFSKYDESQNRKIPNSFSLIYSLCDGNILLESAGGCSATSLLGRFTIANYEVYSMARDLAALEAKANPEVLFFDIGYISEHHADNINRRRDIYQYQLSLMNYDTSTDPMTLDDLFVSLIGDEVVLRSGSLNKRMIPRLASAYNYQRSDLPVFRFLCDLQSQNLQSVFSVRLPELLPDINYYPRLVFKNVIVSPRSWRVRKDYFVKNPGELGIWLKGQGVGRYVKWGAADQTLWFDLHSEIDLIVMKVLLEKHNEMLLEEASMPKSHSIIDEKKRPYLGQYIASVTHDQKIYLGLTRQAIKETEFKQKVVPLGQDWLYFEIYAHPGRFDSLLTQKIRPFLHVHRRLISGWFFIRYNEGGDHIRLRLRLRWVKVLQRITQALGKALEQELITGIVSDFCIRTYRREIERYGVERIFDVENHFSIDSTFVIETLNHQLSTFVRYHLCNQLLCRVTMEGLLITGEMNKFIESMSGAFQKEFELGPEDFKKLNAQYKKFAEYRFTGIDDGSLSLRKNLEESLVELLSKCLPASRGQMLGDLMHMHINRMFSSSQRKYEMVFYYFMFKEMKRRNHQGKAQIA